MSTEQKEKLVHEYWDNFQNLPKSALETLFIHDLEKTETYKFLADEYAIPNANGKGKTIGVYGDSISVGDCPFGTQYSQNWPTEMALMLDSEFGKGEYRVQNFAMSARGAQKSGR
jgi:hypothetical protein